MEWIDCYSKVLQLSPRAAKLAAGMLRKDPLVPPEWQFCLHIALAQQAQGAQSFTREDLAVIAANQRSGFTDELDPDQLLAWEFALWTRQFALHGSQRASARDRVRDGSAAPYPAPCDDGVARTAGADVLTAS